MNSETDGNLIFFKRIIKLQYLIPVKIFILVMTKIRCNKTNLTFKIKFQDIILNIYVIYF